MLEGPLAPTQTEMREEMFVAGMLIAGSRFWLDVAATLCDHHGRMYNAGLLTMTNRASDAVRGVIAQTHAFKRRKAR